MDLFEEYFKYIYFSSFSSGIHLGKVYIVTIQS